MDSLQVFVDWIPQRREEVFTVSDVVDEVSRRANEAVSLIPLAPPPPPPLVWTRAAPSDSRSSHSGDLLPVMDSGLPGLTRGTGGR